MLPSRDLNRAKYATTPAPKKITQSDAARRSADRPSTHDSLACTVQGGSTVSEQMSPEAMMAVAQH